MLGATINMYVWNLMGPYFRVLRLIYFLYNKGQYFPQKVIPQLVKLNQAT